MSDTGGAVTVVGVWKLFGSQAENWYLGFFPLAAFGKDSLDFRFAE